MSMRNKLNDLLAQRNQHLSAAQTAHDSGDSTGFKEAMAKAAALDPQIDELKGAVAEMDRYADLHAPTYEGDHNHLADMGALLMAGKPVKMNVGKILRTNSTLATGPIVAPQGGDSEIHDGGAGVVSSLIDQVSSIDLYGFSSYEEPYVVSDMAAQGGALTTVSGAARTATDPTFAKARLAPYEASVTSFVDRNLARLSPAKYAEKIQTMALRALRRKINDLIINGDGESTHAMFGILNAANTTGAAIYASEALGTAIDETTLDTLIYGYGGSEELGGAARLLLTKASLKAIGALRGTNEKGRIFQITPDAANPNTGVISDGGTIVPYTIVSGIGNTKLAYGDPSNYLLGLFGDYTVRVDESVKAVERMNAILGDALVGGNLVVDKGFVVGTIG